MKIEEIMRRPEYRDEVGEDHYFTQLSEGTLTRLLSNAEKYDFAVITAYKSDLEDKARLRKENVLRNRQLRGILNDNKLGVHPLIGHWRECSIDVPYAECPPDKMIDVIERSYFVVRNNNISQDDFKNLIISLGKQFNQNAVIIKLSDNINLFFMNDGSSVNLGTGITLNKLSQGYSQYIRKINVPFIFEGVEYPNSVSQGKEFFFKDGFRWNSNIK